MTKGFIFDLDGTVYLGNEMIAGAADAINELKSRGDRVVFLTNKSIATRTSYVEKLNKMGIQTTIDEVLNSNYVLALYLSKNLPQDEAVLVIGEQPLFDELAEQSINITEDPNKAKFVILGWDRQFTYDKINVAYQAWLQGAKIIATNPDRTCPMEDGQIPDCAAMIGALEATIGQPIDLIMGKPSALMAETAVSVMNLEYSQCFMVGDRLETDIKMGNDMGMKSVLVLTGITQKEMLESSLYKPKYILDSVKEIVSL